MAKTMLSNLNIIVANTITDSIKMIDINELHDSKDNFFVVEHIEEFADTILGQGGVKDNLIVKPLESGGYEIISGHRRKAAVQYLINKGANISRVLPCLVQNYDDEDTKILDLVLMNISARQISDSELWKSYETVNTILKKEKDNGEKFGKLREKLAEVLGISPAQVGKLQNVEKNAAEPIKKAIESGDISISTANEIAKMDKVSQEELAETDLSSVKHKDVKLKNGNKKKSSDTSKKEKSITSEKRVDTYINSDNTNTEKENINADKPLLSINEFVNKYQPIIDKMFKDYIEYGCEDENEIPIIKKFQAILEKLNK